MKNPLQTLNLAGTLALCAFCVAQWQTNRRLNLQAADAEKERLALVAKLHDLDQRVHADAADLDELRHHLEETNAALQRQTAAHATAEAERTRLAAEKDQLKAAAANWPAAIAARDAALKSAADQANSLAAARDDAVARFNNLAAQYNAAAKQINQAAGQIRKLTDERNDAVAKFNDLAARYNALAKTPADAPKSP